MTTTRRSFTGQPSSVRDARQFVSECTGDLDPSDAEAVALMVSELAANSVRHAESDFEVAVSRTDRDLRVEVSDNGAGRPQLKDPAPNIPSGRGLRIIDALASGWGIVDHGDEGKTVWFSLGLDGAAADGHSHEPVAEHIEPNGSATPSIGPSGAAASVALEGHPPCSPPSSDGRGRRCQRRGRAGRQPAERRSPCCASRAARIPLILR